MRRLGFALFIFGLAQCGDDTRPMGAPCVPTACTNAGKPFDLNGRFGVYVKLYVDVQAAGGIIDQKGVEADLLLLADITQQGAQANMAVQVCDLVLPPIPVHNAPPLTFQVDPALLASVGTVMSGGSIDGAGTCASLQQPAPLVLVLGAKLHDLQHDALPTFDASNGTYMACGGTLRSCQSATAPASGSCVCDQDTDSKLGATLGVMNAPVFSDLNKAYVALRTSVNLTGQVFSSDQIGGTVDSTLEQVILGCQRSGNDCSNSDVGLVQGVAPTIQQSMCTTKMPNLSTFIGKRIAPTTDCATLKMMEGSLFGL